MTGYFTAFDRARCASHWDYTYSRSYSYSRSYTRSWRRRRYGC